MALGDKVTGSVSSMFLDHCIARYNVAKEQNELRRDAVTMYSRKFRRAKDISVAETACLVQVEFQRARTPVGSLSIRWPYHPMLRRKW